MTTEEAVKHLTTQLKTDAGFREGYKANIAMAFVDEWSNEQFQQSDQDDAAVHRLANQAAENFLNLWCGGS